MIMKKPKISDNIFWAVLAVALPTMCEQILSVLMQYVDTAMVGQLGAKATAAVSMSTTITWLVGSIPVAFGVGTMTLISQAIGSGEKHQINRIAKLSIAFAIVVGVILEAICLCICPYVPVWMGVSAEVAVAGTRYFFWISIPIVFKSLNYILAAAIRATKDTKTPMFIGVAVNVLNVILDYIFIYVLGFGVDGAAYATCISSIVGGVAMLMSVLRHAEFDLSGKLFDWDKTLLKKMWRLVYPVLLINIASTSGYIVFSGLVAHLDTIIFAAHSIAVGAEELFYIGGYGFKSATNTMVGIAFGEKNYDKYRKVCISSVVATVCVMTVSGVLLYVFANPLMSFFTSDAKVIELGTKVLKLVAVNEPFFGIYIISEGIYYGLGHTKYPFIIECGGMWLIRILSTYIGLHYFNQGLVYVWCCMIADNIIKAILLLLPVGGLWSKVYRE